MKKYNIFLITALLFLFATNLLAAEENSKTGKFFVNSSAYPLFGWSNYTYSLNEFKKELPANITEPLLPETLQGKDNDILNYAIGIGYYWSDKFSTRINYINDININTRILFNFSGLPDDMFKSDIVMFELDAEYEFLEVTESVSWFVHSGMALYLVDSSYMAAGGRIEDSFNKVALKLGIGLRWDFSKNWGLKFGYTRYSFLDMEKDYLEFEYRW